MSVFVEISIRFFETNRSSSSKPQTPHNKNGISVARTTISVAEKATSVNEKRSSVESGMSSVGLQLSSAKE